MIRLRWTTSHPIADEITRNRLNDMRKGGLLTDMTLTSGLRIYPCHKIIIANASPFIRDVIQVLRYSNIENEPINYPYDPILDGHRIVKGRHRRGEH